MRTGLVYVKLFIFIVFSFVLAGELNAKESERTALEESNLRKAVYCMDILENRPDLESSHRIDILRNECYSENFIEHAPNIKGGRDALLSLFASRYIRSTQNFQCLLNEALPKVTLFGSIFTSNTRLTPLVVPASIYFE